MTIRLPFLRTALAACAAAALIAATPAQAHSANPSDASALSMLPIAVSVAAPSMVLAAGAVFTVVAVEASASGAVWILERASDGARMTLRLSGDVAGAASLGVATAVTVSAVTTGWILVSAGKAIAFVPNEIGRALLHNERITR
jgi:hypothetical protein